MNEVHNLLPWISLMLLVLPLTAPVEIIHPKSAITEQFQISTVVPGAARWRRHVIDIGVGQGGVEIMIDKVPVKDEVGEEVMDTIWNFPVIRDAVFNECPSLCIMHIAIIA